jgi:integrase
MFRLGGREASPRYGGAFGTMREAKIRRDYIAGELAAMRVPDLRRLAAPERAPTLAELAERWQASRVDVAENTRLMHRSAVQAMLPLLGARPVDSITASDVQELIGVLTAKGRKRETTRKSVLALAMILDFADVRPNPARDKVHVKLPRGEQEEISPPSAEAVEAVVRVLPPRYRLPALVLDATGMRLGELEALTWGDVDEQRGRWRITTAASKTRRPRWVQVPPDVLAAVSELVAREDRVPARPVFQGFGANRFRTAVTRACTAAGVPHFSPHDLRHRRISLLHLGGVPWAKIGEHVGQRNLAVTANTYSHVLVDESELDYPELLA